MQTDKAIEKRRSVRSYKKKKVSKSLIKKLLELANLAPTAAGLEFRQFVVIDNPRVKKRLYEAACKQKHILEAPVVVAIITNTNRFHSKKELLKVNEESWLMNMWGATQKKYKNNKKFDQNYKVWNKLYPLQDADAASTTLLLAGKNKGLGSCWIGAFDFIEAEKILELPKGFKITALITLGYEKNPPYPQKRTKVDKLIHWNKW